MKSNYTLSIIIPAYNAQASIASTINSVLNQSHSTIEVIIINDGSTDNTSLVCNELADNDPRITYKEIANSGPAHARNVGMELATGEYIGFVDADDTVENDFYSTMTAEINQHKPDVVMCGFNLQTANSSTPVICNIPPYIALDSSMIKEHVISKYYKGSGDGVESLCNKLYRRDFLQANNFVIDETRVRAEDYWFNLYVYMKCDKFIFIDKAMYNYHVETTGSVMKSYRPGQFELFLETRDKLLELNINHFNFHNIEDKLNFNLVYASLEYVNLMLTQKKFDDFETLVLSAKFQSEVILSSIPNIPNYYRLILQALRVKPRIFALILARFLSKMRNII